MQETMREGIEVFNILERNNVILDGHFELVNRNHSNKYINHRAIFQNPKVSRRLSLMLAERFQQDARDNVFNVVIGPQVYGALLAEKEAEHLTFLCGKTIMPLAALKMCEHCQKRGFYLDEDTSEQIKGKRALFVDDIGNAGTSAKNVINTVHEAGGIVVAVGYLCNRGGLTKEHFPNIEHFEALLDFPLESWNPTQGECESCLNHIPLSTRYGHGGDSARQYFLPLVRK